MSALHVSWGSIELLHSCICTLTLLAEQGQPYPVIEYRKVTLHGTSCAVQTTPGGFVAQSRTGAFITWIADDVKQGAVAQAGPTWAKVDGAVEAAARTWFLKGGLA